MTNCRTTRTFRPRAASIAALLLAGMAAAGCHASGRNHATPGIATGSASDLTLNRGDWVVGRETGVWTATIPGATNASAPVRLGYVTSRLYREMRGGPTFTMYEVTSLDRKDVVGIVDQLGNAKRFKPGRDGLIETEDAGNATLPLSVQAIFQSMKPLTLNKTTERALAFELLDANHDGKLDKTEFPRLADRYASPDKNKDGYVDANEFEMIDDL